MTSTHLSAEEFRRQGRAAVDWVADYLERLESFPVQSQVAPGDVRARLPSSPPERGEPFATVLADLEEVILPGITHWQAPGFFGYFPANSSGPSIMGELVSAGLGVQGMSWSTSPACTELETHVLDWMVELLGLPGRFLSSGAGGGVIQDSASSATLCALLAARERAGGAGGVAGGPLVAYASVEAHSSVAKAVRIAGLEHLRLIEVDDSFALRPEALDAAMVADRRAGRRPFFVCATVGTTGSTALDPLAPIGEICQRHGAWLHVDGAMAGVAALDASLRWIHDGLELADSYCTNPHKWMLVNFDCDCFWVADRTDLVAALSVLPEYLRNPASDAGEVIDYRDWQVPLGRRFRALKLWFVIRHYGASGLRAHVAGHVALAQELAGWVGADPRFELAAPVPLNLVCFRHVGGDDVNRALLSALNATGRVFLTHTALAGRYTIRLCIGSARTERRHVEACWALVQELAPPA